MNFSAFSYLEVERGFLPAPTSLTLPCVNLSPVLKVSNIGGSYEHLEAEETLEMSMAGLWGTRACELYLLTSCVQATIRLKSRVVRNLCCKMKTFVTLKASVKIF